MAISKAQQKAVAKYNLKTYDRIEIKVKKGNKKILEEIAKQNENSLNAYIKTAISEKIKAENGKDIEL